MPTSGPEAVLPICARMMCQRPSRFLDIGCGNGKWGFLAREYADIWHWKPWGTCVVDGVEVFERYILPHHRLIYSRIIIGDALSVLPTLTEPYDIAVCADMIEHLTIEDGRRLLDMIRTVARVAYVTTPVNWYRQGAAHGNEAERHLCLWTDEMLGEWGQVETIGGIHLLTMERR